MKKRLLSTLLILCMVLTLLPGTALAVEEQATSGKCGENVSWYFNKSTGTLSLSGSGATYDYDWDSPPWEDWYTEITKIVVNNGVTSLGRELFYRCRWATEIQLPSSLEAIDTWYALPTESVESVTVIGNTGSYVSYDGVLYGINGLHDSSVSGTDGPFYLAYYPPARENQTYSIRSGTDGIGSSAFSSNPYIKTVYFNSDLKSIEDSAFAYCTALESLVIPDNVTEIASLAFLNCVSLTELRLPANLQTLDLIAFSGCDSLSEIIVPKAVTTVLSGATPPDYMGFDNNMVRSFYFEGNAPQAFDDDSLISTSTNDVIKTIFYYKENTSGWNELAKKHPEVDFRVWTGSGPSVPDVDTTARILSKSPAHGSSDVEFGRTSAVFEITFDRDILSFTPANYADLNFDAGTIRIYQTSHAEPLYKAECDDYLADLYGSSGTGCNDIRVMNGSKLQVVVDNRKFDPETSYYITLDAGFVQFVDGTTNPAIAKGEWGFTTKAEEPPTLFGSNFEMGIDSLSFNNFQTYYGDNAFYISAEHQRILLNKLSLKDALIVDLNALVDSWRSDFGGECFGASAVMALMYVGALDATTFQPNAETVFELDMPKNSKKIASLIYYYHLLQGVAIFKEEDVDKTQSAMGEELIGALVTDTTPVIVNLHVSIGDHSVLAYALDQDSDKNNYLVYIADPNVLVVTSDGKANKPSILYIDKTTHRINNYLFYNIYNGAEHNEPVTFASVISDLSLFEKYNLQDAILKKNSLEQPVKYTLIETSAPTLTIKANGKQIVITDGNIGDGNLTVYKTYGNLSVTGDESTEKQYAYCVEVADSYEIIYPDNQKYDTQVSFAASTDKYCRVVSTADEIRFISNGTVEFEGAISGSEVTVSVDSVYDAWYGLTISCSTDNLTLEPEANSYKISSETSLGDISVAGKVLWNDITASATMDDNSAHVVEITDSDDITYLTIIDDENTALSRAPVTYSVTYFSQGGSFVDAISNIPYGSTITAPKSPTYEGYTFGGWYKDSSCSAGQEWNFSTDTVTEDTVLYAKWTARTSGSDPSDIPGKPSNPNTGGSEDTSYSDPTYSIMVPSRFTGGTVKVTPTSASEGQRVTITVKANSGYELDALTVTDSKGNTLTLTDQGNGKYTFTMPKGNVSVDAQFQRIESSVTPVQPVSVNPTNDKLEVDGKPQTPAAYKINDYNYFKLRDIAALLNGTGKQFSVGYESSTGEVSLTSGQPYEVTTSDLTALPAESRQATISTNVIYINGVRTQLTVYNIDGFNYFKLRDLASALNFSIGWTAEKGMFLESNKPYSA